MKLVDYLKLGVKVIWYQSYLNAIWGDKFTSLVKKYMWSLDELEERGK